MAQSDIAAIINSYVETNLSLPEISNDAFRTVTGGICCRHDPSPAAERRHADGSRLVTWNLTYYARNKNMKQARKTVYDIADFLDGREIRAEDMVIYCEAATLPQYIDTDEKEQAIYSATVTATYAEGD